MYRKFDVYDWHYRKSELWTDYLAGVIFWPILLLTKQSRKNLISSKVFFSGGDSLLGGLKEGMANRQREEDRLWNNPPYCSGRISYSVDNDNGNADLIFKSADVADVLRKRLENAPHLMRDHEGSLLKWIEQRNSEDNNPVDVPTAWHRFIYLVDDLMRDGHAEITCRACQNQVAVDQIRTDDDRGKPGWNFKRTYCPEGHLLLRVEGVHLLMRMDGE